MEEDEKTISNAVESREIIISINRMIKYDSRRPRTRDENVILVECTLYIYNVYDRRGYRDGEERHTDTTSKIEKNEIW